MSMEMKENLIPFFQMNILNDVDLPVASWNFNPSPNFPKVCREWPHDYETYYPLHAS